MNVCFFTKHEIDWVSSRVRVGIYLNYFKEKGHNYKIIYVIPNKLSRKWIGGKARFSFYSLWYSRILKHLKLIWIVIIAKRFDVILVQKVNLLYQLVWVLSRRNKKIIFDFDDQCFWNLESVQANKISLAKRLSFWRKGIQHPKVLKLYRHIIAGNEYLANIAAKTTKRENISIIPTPIDCNLYLPKENILKNGPVIIGWVGSGENHLKNLELLVTPFKELSKKYDFIFKLAGAMYSIKIRSLFDFLGSRFICINWVENREIPLLIQTFDIGVMPLKDDDESRGKCALKALEYMATGVPVVISPVGINQEIVKDGINGFLAQDNAEWIKKLSFLIENKELRKKLAQKGRETVEESYSLDKSAQDFIKVIEKVNNEEKSMPTTV